MLNFPDIDPVAFALGPLEIYWYGISYLLGFLGAYWLTVYRCSTVVGSTWNKAQVLDLLFYVALGVIFGGRLGYVLIYEPMQIFADPIAAFAFWARGRSFHGGLLGVLVAVGIYSLVQKRKFFAVTDFIAPAVPIGIAFGRLGNFINGELWGRVTNVPWGMIFPGAGDLPRHPSQLYEFMLEGVVLFIIMYLYASKPRQLGAVSGMFLLAYGILRFIGEIFREPDIGQGFIWANWLTMGQVLSVPMILFGWYFLLRPIKQRH